MVRMYDKREMMNKCSDEICPRIRKMLEKAQLGTRYCNVRPAVGQKFQVSIADQGYVVSLQEHICSCRQWDLSGIPCPHALACIHFMKHDSVAYINRYYSKLEYLKAYKYALEPLNEFSMWSRTDATPILFPPYKRMPGRLKKKRKKDVVEIEGQDVGGPHGMHMTCQHCLQTGHNKRGCPNKNKTAAPRPPKAKRDRPRATTNASAIAPSTTRSRASARSRSTASTSVPTTATASTLASATAGASASDMQVPMQVSQQMSQQQLQR
ncbi:uncharacterized protein LOC127786693 [Diospyros lotus]|uniref:uncharacterized protein LOC127786693 n=1 Tax=Diospyros lotus TaxID=55363 RepID=UPI00225914F2|nr:uncharacterized protein LOC127786693 [Diospyros lotus]